jgi:hypothetical protein
VLKGNFELPHSEREKMKRYWKWSISVLSTILMLAVAACSQVSQTPAPETPSEQAPLVNLTLSNGNGLEFYAAADNPENILVLEAVKEGGSSALGLLSEKGMTLNQLTAHDIFWAFAKPGTAVPSALTHEDTKASQRTQGWASELLAETPESTTIAAQGVTVACDNGPFLQNYINLGLPQGPNTFLALDKTPAGGSPFATYIDPNLPTVRYKFDRTTFNSKWYGSICLKAVQNSANNHNVGTTYFGPYMTFEYLSGGVWKHIGVSPKVVPANWTLWYNYVWITDHTLKRITVQRALAQDQFDIANVSDF